MPCPVLWIFAQPGQHRGGGNHPDPMSYTIDVYKRRCRVETNLLHYALFVSFFPTLINGPIERYPQMRPQIQKSRRFSGTSSSSRHATAARNR